MIEKTVTAAEIAALVKGKLIGDPNRLVKGVASLKDATADQLSFVGNKKYQHLLADAKAGTVIVCPDLADEPTENRTLIVSPNVDYAFGHAVMVFAEKAPEFQQLVHPSAVVDASVKLGNGVSIGANAVIEPEAEIGDGAIIGAGCYIGHQVRVGAGTLLYPNVTVMYRCRIGRKCIIHPGVVVGADGFGFVPGPQGLVKVPQTGIVQIDDDVEIGANTTIDRARFGVTHIKSNVKIDDQVMIAHNVCIGESSILVAQCGIAGSAEIGRGVILAAKSGVNGHITLGDGVQVAGTSGVVKSVPAGQIVLGTPAEPQREFMARYTLPKRVEKLSAKLKELEAKLAELEKK
ncbi:MAG: UDP-3-O-(3-hydroxymyristoyl)glucosamine N-acyltransferase [Victivallaceae bacterium]|nr:UDP-3-O-(3-hydroxymyristoyl)glucosamine N-acyltransferase [Victivallaceae bacterium]